MPFPWKKKKNRVTRISQFVADFQSPKHTSSLVVQTGFPTSLIDLFAKNRNRFNNSTFKKPLRSEIIDPSSSPSPPPPPPPPPPSPVTSPPSVSQSPIHEVFSAELLAPTEPLIGDNTDDDTGDVIPVNKRRSSFRSKSIIVKILTVIVLAASVKELTVAITVSAFVLLFLENSLKRVVSFLKPCSNAFVSIESLFQKIPFHLKAKSVHKPVLDDGEIELLNLNCCGNDEIEVVEEKSELGICRELEDSSAKEIVEEKYLKERIQFRSRSGRFKATMVKKLQKFRSFKREKKEEEKGNQDNNVCLNASNNKKEEIESCSDVSSVICEEDKQEVKNEIDCGINCSREESIIVVGNTSYAAILVMVALIGLIVGRLQALFLTIGWCLLVKMVRSIWRSKNGSSLDGIKLGGLDH